MDGKWLWSIFAVVESWLEERMNGGQDKDGWSANGPVDFSAVSSNISIDMEGVDADTGTYTKTNPFTVESGATLVLVPGANLGTSVLTVRDGGTLEVAESGTVTLNGGLNLTNGVNLAFNFTRRATAPLLALDSGKMPFFTEGQATNITVKVSGDVWPRAGEKELTACGGFDAKGVTVTLADGAPWAKDVGVNKAGNIVLTVKPKPAMIIVR